MGTHPPRDLDPASELGFSSCNRRAGCTLLCDLARLGNNLELTTHQNRLRLSNRPWCPQLAFRAGFGVPLQRNVADFLATLRSEPGFFYLEPSFFDRGIGGGLGSPGLPPPLLMVGSWGVFGSRIFE